MTRGYQVKEIREKIVDLLQTSNTGLSGVEISKRLGINRITVTKYLNIFAAEGLIQQNNIGNITLWSAEQGLEKYRFPDDYFQIAPKYIEFLINGSENQVYSLIKNCLYSGATVPKLVSEVIIPAISNIIKLYDDGKIGLSEAKLLQNIISNSLQIFIQSPVIPDKNKNIVIISGDSQNTVISEAASASFHFEGWRVFNLGDMSSSIDVLFELDLQKLLRKIWKQKQGIMIIGVFAETEEGLKFFANSVNTLKKKIGKNIKLVLYGKVSKKTKIDSDLISTDIDEILRWCQTSYENLEK